jgi:putative ABC transport system permease protein
MLDDLRDAVRRMARWPFHAAVVVLTLGLGLGAALAVLAVVDAVLIRPLPYRNASRLVDISQSLPVDWLPELSLSDVGYRRIASDARTLEAVAAWNTRDANLLGRGEIRRLIVAQTTASLLEVLDLKPLLGRGFAAEEDRPGGPRALLLSHWLWRAAFHGDSGVVGTKASLEGEPYVIVGVLPSWVSFPSKQIGAWEPLRLDPASNNPFGRSYEVVGRLRPGVSLAQAIIDVTGPIRAVGREFPGPHSGSGLDQAGYTARVRYLADEVVGDSRSVVVLLLCGVTLLLVLTCANVVNLQLAGAASRGEELAVRAALGATSGRLVRAALLEGIVLAAGGAAVGGSVALLGTRLLATLLPQGIALDAEAAGGRGLLLVSAFVVGIGAVVGALPVLLSAREDPADALRGRAAGGRTARAARVRRVLAALQVSLAVLLLHGSGLLLASAAAVKEVPLGFRPDSTMSLLFNLPAGTLRNRAARETLLRGLLEDAGRIPGVTGAALVNALPLTQGRRDLAMAVEGRPFKADGTDPLADYRVVSGSYFATMGIRLVRGRLFSDDDANPRFTPVVVSQSLARQLFPDGSDPVGHRLRFGPAAPWMPIVGVVTDAKNRSVTEASRPELYLPGLGTWSDLAFRTEIALVVRGGGNGNDLASALRGVVHRAAPDLATYAVMSLADIVRDSRVRLTTATRLMSGYAVAALLLAALGTYAVLSYLVSQRRRELAVRMALGAGLPDVVRLVGREAALMMGVGAGAGLLAALGSARLLRSLLFGVGTLDPMVVLAVVVAAGLAGVGAALLPAVRAARVPPAEALRSGG